jgi:putative sterol carrier protein
MRTVLPNGLILGLGFPFNSRFPDYYLRTLGLPSRAKQVSMAQGKTDRMPAGPSAASHSASAWELISKMPDVFNAETAGGLSATIGFIVSGSETFETYLNIHGGFCTLEEKPSHKPDLIIHTPAEVWLGISGGQLDGQEAFMRQAYTVEGNVGLLMSMKNIFRAEPSAK